MKQILLTFILSIFPITLWSVGINEGVAALSAGEFLKVDEYVITGDTLIIDGKSKVIYESIANTLTLDNVEFTAWNNNDKIISCVESNIDGLIINIVGNCKLKIDGTGKTYCFSLGGNTTITGDSLTLSDFFWEELMHYYESSSNSAFLLTNDVTLTIKDIRIRSNMIWAGGESGKEPIGELVISNSDVYFPYLAGTRSTWYSGDYVGEDSNISQFRKVTLTDGSYMYPSRLTFTANAYDKNGNVVAHNVASNDGINCYCGPIRILREKYCPIIEGVIETCILPNSDENGYMGENTFLIYSYDMLGLNNGDRISSITYRGRKNSSYPIENKKISIFYSWMDEYLFGSSVLVNDYPDTSKMSILVKDSPILASTFVQNNSKQDIIVLRFQNPIEYKEGKSLCIGFHSNESFYNYSAFDIEKLSNPLFNDGDQGYFYNSGKYTFMGIDIPAVHIALADSTSVSIPTISFDGKNCITMSCSTDSATIHYTLDGLTPTEYSPVYSGPITITGNIKIRAVAMTYRGLVCDCSKVASLDMMGDATFDGLVATVSGDGTLEEAFESVGGRSEAVKTIAAIVWDKETALADSLLQGITNPNLLVYVNRQELAPNINNVVVNGVAKNIVLTDTEGGNNNFYCPRAFVAEDISYSHEFTQQAQYGNNNGWESIALPFTVQNVTHESQGALSPYGSSAGGKQFWLRRNSQNGLATATKIEANIPYLIRMPNDADVLSLAGHVTFSAKNATVPVSNVSSERSGMINLKPSYCSYNGAYPIGVGDTIGNDIVLNPDGSVENAIKSKTYNEEQNYFTYVFESGLTVRTPYNIQTGWSFNNGVLYIEHVLSVTVVSNGNGEKYMEVESVKYELKPNNILSPTSFTGKSEKYKAKAPLFEGETIPDGWTPLDVEVQEGTVTLSHSGNPVYSINKNEVVNGHAPGSAFVYDYRQIHPFECYATYVAGNSKPENILIEELLANPLEGLPDPEPYAVLTDSSTVLTFYYDDQKEARGGMSVGPFSHAEWNDEAQEYKVDGRGWGKTVTSVVFDESFANCTTLTSTAYWFYSCYKMTTITNIEYLKTDNVTDMNNMFEGCRGLTSLDVSNFKTDNVTNMYAMFSGCSGLTALDVSNFKTDNVTNMCDMFAECSGLTSLDVSHFKTNKVTNMSWMFRNCSGLTSLDVTNFKTDNVTYMGYMFGGCTNLKTIYASNDWSTASVQNGNDMFAGCTNLVGGMGTVYDENHVDHTYAHIDGGSSNPGYFTDKNAPVIIGEATFDGLVATVSGNRQLDEAFVEVGGRGEAAKTIAAIVWNKETALTDSLLQGITNPNLLVYVNSQATAPTIINNVVVNGVARNVVLTDTQTGNNNFYCPQTFRAEHISYRHYFQQETQPGVSRGWEGIALPFNVQTITHEHHGALHPFGTPEEGYPFWLRQLTPNGIVQAVRMIANRPYIISMPNSQAYHDEYNQSGWVTFAANDVTVPVTTTMVTALADSSIVMIPTMQRVEQATEVYAINRSQPYAGYPEGSIFVSNLREVRPFEAYTEHHNASPAPMFYPIDAWMDGGTGIDEMENELLTIDNAYNLNGQRVKTPRKGVFIVNGRKTVVK